MPYPARATVLGRDIHCAAAVARSCAASTPEHVSVRVMSPTTQPTAEPNPHESDEAKAERVRREARQMDSAMWTIVGHMTASLLVYGGVGYLLGRWLGHPILLLFGVLLGMATSLTYTFWLAARVGGKR
jgi:hypothetical protein